VPCLTVRARKRGGRHETCHVQRQARSFSAFGCTGLSDIGSNVDAAGNFCHWCADRSRFQTRVSASHDLSHQFPACLIRIRFSVRYEVRTVQKNIKARARISRARAGFMLDRYALSSQEHNMIISSNAASGKGALPLSSARRQAQGSRSERR
jgi:hypothetical protein